MNPRIRMIIFVLVLGTILTSALAVVDHVTSPIIARNTSQKLKTSVLEALRVPFRASDVDRVFANQVNKVEKGGRTYYVSRSGELALPISGKGVWGPITGILAMKPGASQIVGITIMHEEETPGLGSRIAEQPFLRQFIGKVFSPVLKMVAPGKSESNGTNVVDSISGATLSSKAFLALLNSEHEAYRKIMQGDQ